MLKVAKFGGSSMASAEQIKKVQSIVQADSARRVVVVSAIGKRTNDDHKVTDLLYLAYAHIKYGVSPDAIFNLIQSRYCEIADLLGLSDRVKKELSAIKSSLKKGVSEAWLVSRGEYLSAVILSELLGYQLVDSASWVNFNYDKTINTEASYKALKQLVGVDRVVIPGFYGVFENGELGLMERGGSDITGALAAAALEADIYENWTDVPGILIADPRIVQNPRSISNMTFAELREISYMGAQVLHESAIEPIRSKGIPLNIRNTNDPTHPGTMIQDEIAESGSNKSGAFITGIIGRKDYTLVTVAKTGLSSMKGAVRQMLEAFEKRGIAVDFLPSGIDSITLAVETHKAEKALYPALNDMQELLGPSADVKAEGDISVIAVIGRKMIGQTGVLSRVFTALAKENINIRIFCQDANELDLIIGVANADLEKAVNTLYNGFVA